MGLGAVLLALERVALESLGTEVGSSETGVGLLGPVASKLLGLEVGLLMLVEPGSLRLNVGLLVAELKLLKLIAALSEVTTALGSSELAAALLKPRVGSLRPGAVLLVLMEPELLRRGVELLVPERAMLRSLLGLLVW